VNPGEAVPIAVPAAPANDGASDLRKDRIGSPAVGESPATQHPSYSTSQASSILSERDVDVVSFVAAAGLATARQLERLAFLPTDLGSATTASRRARRSLQRLTDAGYLNRLERRIGGVRAGSAGFVYQVGARGLRAIGQRGRGRHWEPSSRFVDHTLATVELHVQLVEAERAGRIAELRVTHEPATWRRFTGRRGTIEVLKPDLLVEFDTPDGWSLRWFVEVDRGSEHLPTVIGKCHTYQLYWQSGVEAAQDELFPRVLWSVPDETRAGRIRAAIDHERSLTDDLFRLATDAATLDQLIDNDQPQEQEGGEP
jgi:hypothetical protein